MRRKRSARGLGELQREGSLLQPPQLHHELLGHPFEVGLVLDARESISQVISKPLVALRHPRWPILRRRRGDLVPVEVRNCYPQRPRKRAHGGGVGSPLSRLKRRYGASAHARFLGQAVLGEAPLFSKLPKPQRFSGRCSHLLIPSPILRCRKVYLPRALRLVLCALHSLCPVALGY